MGSKRVRALEQQLATQDYALSIAKEALVQICKDFSSEPIVLIDLYLDRARETVDNSDEYREWKEGRPG